MITLLWGGRMARPAEVRRFLTQFVAAMRGQFVFVPRKKNLDALAETGLLPVHIKHIVAGLTTHYYATGPATDYDNARHAVWVYGTTVNGVEYYVKLSDDFGGACAKCLSFHKAEKPLQYPLRRP